MAQVVKNLPAMRETWIRFLDWEDPLEKGNGYPLQYSCLENSMDRGAWWATVHGVTKSQTELTNTFPWASQVGLATNNPTANAVDIRDMGSILGSGRSPGGRNGNSLQYSCLENLRRSLTGYSLQGP